MNRATPDRVWARVLWLCLGISAAFLMACPCAWSAAAVLKDIRAAEHDQYTRVVLDLEGGRPEAVKATRKGRLEIAFEALILEAERQGGAAGELELLQELPRPDPSDPNRLVLTFDPGAYVDHYVYEADKGASSDRYHLVLDLYPNMSAPVRAPKAPAPAEPQEEPAQEEVVYQSLDQAKRVRIRHVVKSAPGNQTESREQVTEAPLTRLHRIRVGEHDGYTRVVLDAEGRWPEVIRPSKRNQVEFSFERLERLFPRSMLGRLSKGAVKEVMLDEEGQPRLSIEFHETDTRVSTMFLAGSPARGDHFRLVIDLYPPRSGGTGQGAAKTTGREEHGLLPTGRTVKVAVVRDGPSTTLFELETRVEKELAELLPQGTRLAFMRRGSFDAGWRPGSVAGVLNRAADDPMADLVFANGVLSTEQAARSERGYAVPVVGGMLFDSSQGSAEPRKTNVHLVSLTSRILKDLRVFQDLVGWTRVAFCIEDVLFQGLPGLSGELDRMSRALGVKIVPVLAGREPASVLEALGPETEALYLTPLLRMTAEDWTELIRSLNERRIPTFSLFGHPDVRKGVLASQTPDVVPRLARRLALDMLQILDGAEPHSLSRAMTIEDQLLFNARTARQIGFDPRLGTVVEAQVLHREALEGDAGQSRALSLEKAMEMAGQGNVAVAIEGFRTLEAGESAQQAGSAFLPHAEAGLQTFRIDKDRSRASLALAPWQRTTGSIAVRQLIFDDEVLSRYLAAKHLEQGQELETESVRLDVTARAGELFLQLLQARALERIEQDNLDLTREHLRLARIRRRVGMSGPEDVFRWEAQEATHKGDLLAAGSRVEKLRVALNQVLGLAQNTKWRPQGIQLKDQELFFLGPRFRQAMQTAGQVRKLRHYAVEVALDNAPELRAADQAIRAAQVELGQKQRRFYVPTIGASFDYTRELDREDPELSFGSGTGGPPGMAVPDIGSEISELVSDRDRDEWRVAVELKLPLFQGGKRFHDVDLAEATLSRLRSQKTRAAQILEQQARSAVYDLQSSQPRIGLARRAAEQASKNLDLVQDKYARGAATVLDLLDAQNEAQAQEQAAVIAVYRYLQDLVRFQRAMSWFEHQKTEQERQAWIQGFATFTTDGRGRGDADKTQ